MTNDDLPVVHETRWQRIIRLYRSKPAFGVASLIILLIGIGGEAWWATALKVVLVAACLAFWSVVVISSVLEFRSGYGRSR